jgi:ParB-like chromosome segregation protein Spo0J
MKYHEFANLFPMMNPDEWEQLEESVAEYGLLEPIVLFENQILDGRNRFEAARATGREIKTVEFEGTREEALNFVIQHNLIRRQLDTTRKVVLGVNMLPLYEGRWGGDRKSDQEGNIALLKGKASEQVAKLVGVGARYISDGKYIKENMPLEWQRLEEAIIDIAHARRLAMIHRRNTEAYETIAHSKADEATLETTVKAASEAKPEEIEQVIEETLGDPGYTILKNAVRAWRVQTTLVFKDLLDWEDKETIQDLTKQTKDDIIYLYNEVIEKL